MIVNNNIKENLPIDWNSFYVVADFDGTITTDASMTSWSILSKSPKVPKEYVADRNEYYNHYRPIEIDESLDLEEKKRLMKEWYQKHIELFIKYKIKEDLFIEAAKDIRVMNFRPGAKEFIDFLHEHNIPLIIISAGIGNFIECFLLNNNCYYDNIYISSNKILFDNKIANGVGQNIIHSLNKNEVSLPNEIKATLKNRSNVLLLGNLKGDLLMVDKEKHNKVITVCFQEEETRPFVNEYKKLFDIIVEENEDYYTLKKVLEGND